MLMAHEATQVVDSVDRMRWHGVATLHPAAQKCTQYPVCFRMIAQRTTQNGVAAMQAVIQQALIGQKMKSLRCFGSHP